MTRAPAPAAVAVGGAKGLQKDEEEEGGGGRGVGPRFLLPSPNRRSRGVISGDSDDTRSDERSETDQRHPCPPDDVWGACGQWIGSGVGTGQQKHRFKQKQDRGKNESKTKRQTREGWSRFGVLCFHFLVLPLPVRTQIHSRCWNEGMGVKKCNTKLPRHTTYS